MKSIQQLPTSLDELKLFQYGNGEVLTIDTTMSVDDIKLKVAGLKKDIVTPYISDACLNIFQGYILKDISGGKVIEECTVSLGANPIVFDSDGEIDFISTKSVQATADLTEKVLLEHFYQRKSFSVNVDGIELTGYTIAHNGIVYYTIDDNIAIESDHIRPTFAIEGKHLYVALVDDYYCDFEKLIDSWWLIAIKEILTQHGHKPNVMQLMTDACFMTENPFGLLKHNIARVLHYEFEEFYHLVEVLIAPVFHSCAVIVSRPPDHPNYEPLKFTKGVHHTFLNQPVHVMYSDEQEK